MDFVFSLFLPILDMLINISNIGLYMNSDEKRKLREKLRLLKQELQDAPCWINGTVIESTRKQSKTVKPFYYLSQSVNGKTKTTYIAPRHLESFKKAAAEGIRLKEILSEINSINILMLKSESNNAS